MSTLTKRGAQIRAVKVAAAFPGGNLVQQSHLAATVVVRSAGEMSTPKRSHQMITLW